MEQQTVIEDNLAQAKTKIEAILKEHKVALVPVSIISGDRVASRVDIVPVPPDSNS